MRVNGITEIIKAASYEKRGGSKIIKIKQKYRINGLSARVETVNQLPAIPNPPTIEED